MKTVTHRKIRIMQNLLYTKRAYFWIEPKDGKLYFTYLRGGWLDRPKIDGKELEYVAEHDDGNIPLNKLTVDRSSPEFCKPIMGRITGIL